MKKPKFTEEQQKAFQTVGRMGGKANVKKHGKDHMKNIGKKGLAVRWANKEIKEKNQ